MKKMICVIALLVLTVNTQATIPVIDYSNLLQNVQNYLKEALIYVKNVEISVNTHLTVLNQITQIENELLALERLGDPRVLINLPGIQQIALLKQIYQQAVIDVETIASFVTPDGIQANANAIMGIYGFGKYNGFTSGWGVKFTPRAPLLQFSTSDYNANAYAKTRVQQLMTQKQTLTTERDTAIAAEKAATDETTKHSYAAQIAALNGAIADINQSINQTLAFASVQVRMNASAQEVFNGVGSLQSASAFQQTEELGIATLGGTPAGTAPGLQTDGTVVGNSSEFGYVDNPAIGGNGDPGTTGNWYTGANGTYIGGQNSTGISLPLATEVAMFGSEQNALGQNVMVTNNANGVSVATTIVDVGPGASAVAKGNIVDLTYGTATQLGTEGKSTNVTVSKVQ